MSDRYSQAEFRRLVDERYLAQLRKSDFEVFGEKIVRDIGLCFFLPKDQRVAMANLLRDRADLLELEGD